MTGESEALMELAQTAQRVRERLPTDSPWRETCEIIAEEANKSAERHLPARQAIESPDCAGRRRVTRRG